MKIFIYGFEKFDKLETNPSSVVCKIIENYFKNEKDINLKVEIFGVNQDFKKNLENSIRNFKPNLVLGIGAAKRNRVCVESISLNINKKEDDVALKTDFDCNLLLNHLKKTDIPCEISYFAGTYICNDSYYHCLNLIKKDNMDAQAVFVHVPLSPAEVNRLGVDAPSFPPEIIANALISFLQSYK